jgi:hypothetical protein
MRREYQLSKHEPYTRQAVKTTIDIVKTQAIHANYQAAEKVWHPLDHT